ncbi:MAG: hypothetical protein MI923_11555 [Phycisphaerales bacterium]|nr:hypothetical protein [Phycisphaerales bacterium]
MDHRSTVSTGIDTAVPTVHTDQAIFTSVRTPTGEGYRIIAASSGLSGDEKAEITRKAPSHGSLCSSEPVAQGLSAYSMASGRYCVGFSRHAGKEHTARGGQRVYTHFVILNQEDYALFGCHPRRVHEAMKKVVGDEPMLKPPRSLECLSLPVDDRHDTRNEQCIHDCPIEHLLQISLAMLQGDHLLVVGAGQEFDLFNRSLLTLPLVVRRSLAVSVGLTYSPVRKTQLCFIARDRGEAQRATRGQNIRWFDLDEPSSRSETPFDDWLDLLERRLHERRDAEIEQMTSAMPDDTSAESLIRIASICADKETVDTADLPRLTQLTVKYETFVACNRLETNLIKQLKTQVQRRTVYLEKIAEKEAMVTGTERPDS